jgi:hypothetical protein
LIVEKTTDGARHKDKAATKAEEKVAAAAAKATSGGKSAAKEEKPEKEKKKVLLDTDGNELKKPLSAYMLYNNHRRPVLKTEHPGKFLYTSPNPLI